MLRLTLCLLLLIATANAAPAPLPRREKPQPWPCGVWELQKRPPSKLTIRRDGTATELWHTLTTECRWWRENDGRICVYTAEGGGCVFVLRPDGKDRLLTSYPYDSAVMVRLR